MDAHHKATTDIVANHQNITIETLSVKNMMKNHHLAFTLADASMSKFLSYIKYKSEREGRHLVEANRFFASSKTCKCGHKNEELKSKELFVCPKCGYTSDRDEHGAQNLYEYSPEAIGFTGRSIAPKRTRKEESSNGDVLPIAVPLESLRKQKELSILKRFGNLPD